MVSRLLHQAEVGVGYFDAIQAVGADSVAALADSTESEQLQKKTLMGSQVLKMIDDQLLTIIARARHQLHLHHLAYSLYLQN